jgi:hypothetical protein
VLGAFDETRYRLQLHNVGQMSLTVISLLGLLILVQLDRNYQQLKRTLAVPAGTEAETLSRIREGMVAVHGNLLLAPFAELNIFSNTEVNEDHIKQKIDLGADVMRFAPLPRVVYRQAFLLAQDGQLAEAKRLLEQAIWSYPGNGNAHQLLVSLAEKDPAHFSALLEFALHKEQEHARAIHQQ